ncbi:MAG: PrsW family glutamic-type intramembrane protease [Gammaproteobacteria bacterium]
MTELITRGSIALLPVLVFLGTLLYLDSYKIVRFRAVLLSLAVGAAAAGASYVVHRSLLPWTGLGFMDYARYVSPVVEESLKALILIFLIRTHRVGLLVDGAVVGFAVGTGFAVAENLYYLLSRSDPNTALWVVRGFGTAIMHGGAMAVFAVASVGFVESRPGLGPLAFVPGFGLAVILHSAFNHFLLWPVWSTLGILVALPVLLYWVFGRSESALREWIGEDFDSDLELLSAIRSQQFARTHVGRYLRSLKSRFRGEVMADLICYVRLHVELALRAKGILMMRESGFTPQVDPETREKFDELHYLEKSIGRTGLRALQPVLKMSRKDLWQFYVLDT